MSESVNVPQGHTPKFKMALGAGYEQRPMEPTRWGIFYKWNKEDEDDEWLCDHKGIVFVFEFRDEAEAMRVLLNPGDGVEIEVKPFEGDEPAREYPWPETELITV